MRVLQGILLSLLFHFFVAWSAQFAPLWAPAKPEAPITVEIVETDESQNETDPQKQKQMVRQTDAPEELKTDESEDPLTFFSERTQRVKRQMQAAESGMTANRSAQGSSNSRPAPSEQQQPPAPRNRTVSKAESMDDSGLEAFTPKYRTTPENPSARAPSEERGFSTIGEALPQDVAVGSFTALNTDRYLYYSFFSRIEEMIRFRWESSVRQAIDTTPPERFTNNTSGVWTTHLEIWLKRNGEFDSAHVMKESGMRSFDRAAVQSFMQARMFPNPPEEMVESDGLIRLKYSFQVRYEPKVVVRSRQ